MKHKNIGIGKKINNSDDASFILFGVRQSYFLKKNRKTQQKVQNKFKLSTINYQLSTINYQLFLIFATN